MQLQAKKEKGKWETLLTIRLGKHKTKTAVREIAKGQGLKLMINGKSMMWFGEEKR